MDALGEERGVTLLELLVALVLGVLLIAGVLAVWRETQVAYLDGAEAAEAQQSLRVAMERVVEVVRNAGANPTGILNFSAFGQAGEECLRVFADLQGDADGSPPDGDINDPWEDLRFEYMGGVFRQRNGAGGSQSLAFGIIPNPGPVPIFQYFDQAGAPIAAGGRCGMSPGNLRLISRVIVTLTAQGTVQGQGVTRTLRSEVRPRNVPD